MSSRPRRSSRDAATAKPPRICKHPSSEPVDATSCTLRLLRQAVDNLNQNRCLLCDLDFVNLDDNLIIQLFYKADRRDHRSVDSDGNIILPPPTHRCTSQQLKQWFEKGTLQKNNAIEEFSKYDTLSTQTAPMKPNLITARRASVIQIQQPGKSHQVIPNHKSNSKKSSLLLICLSHHKSVSVWVSTSSISKGWI